MHKRSREMKVKGSIPFTFTSLLPLHWIYVRRGELGRGGGRGRREGEGGENVEG